MNALRYALTGTVVGLFTLTGLAFAQDRGTVGISMPTKTSARWIADGENMVAQFQEAGYETDLQYADDNYKLGGR